MINGGFVSENIMEALQIGKLFNSLLLAWNERDAKKMASLFTENGSCIGFDGSQMNGRTEIESEVGRIFANHQTAAYVGKIREVRFLNSETALLRAVAGMVPHGQLEIDQKVNAVQSLVAVYQGGKWRIALFQNTPAQFLGRSELSDKLTGELREVLSLSTA